MSPSTGKKGKLKQFALDRLRTTTAPLTSRDITETGVVLTELRVSGVVTKAAQIGGYKAWVSVR